MEQHEERLWWCGWEVPHSIPREHMLEKWPERMQGWHSGGGFTFETYTGAVWSPTPEGAMEVVRSAYGPSGGAIVERWSPQYCEDDWKPTDRFPDYRLKKPTGARA